MALPAARLFSLTTTFFLDLAEWGREGAGSAELNHQDGVVVVVVVVEETAEEAVEGRDGGRAAASSLGLTITSATWPLSSQKEGLRPPPPAGPCLGVTDL